MTKYNTLNLHGYIFTAVQNSQYFIKSKDFHLGLRILRSKAPFGPKQSEMIYWNWFKMSAEGTRTICVFCMCRSCCILSAQRARQGPAKDWLWGRQLTDFQLQGAEIPDGRTIRPFPFLLLLLTGDR